LAIGIPPGENSKGNQAGSGGYLLGPRESFGGCARISQIPGNPLSALAHWVPGRIGGELPQHGGPRGPRGATIYGGPRARGPGEPTFFGAPQARGPTKTRGHRGKRPLYTRGTAGPLLLGGAQRAPFYRGDHRGHNL